MRTAAAIIYILIQLTAIQLKSTAQIPMTASADSMAGWTSYPTYPAYQALMRQWADSSPDLARLIEIGRSQLKRPILAMRITAPGDTSSRPAMLISSTIHGNETTGYMLSLRLIDSLISSYRPGGATLLDRAIIYIVPIINPDGTYAQGDLQISRPTRENAIGIDLNRNFPIQGTGPDPSRQQPETAAMMRLAASRRFTFSLSFHGGDEVVNYPWDSYPEGARPLPDLAWWRQISAEYVDSVRAFSSQYMRTVNSQGHVYGSSWYQISGGMQDWMYSQMRCRETTIELSQVRTATPAQAAYYWNICRGAITQMLYRGLQGFSGTVTDLLGNPIAGAEIYITGHDEDCSPVMSNQLGRFFRPSAGGQCIEVCAQAPGYITSCATVITGDMHTSQAGIALAEDPEPDLQESADGQKICIISANGNITVDSPGEIDAFQLTSATGHTIASMHPRQSHLEYATHNLPAGIYVIRLRYSNITKTQKITIVK